MTLVDRSAREYYHGMSVENNCEGALESIRSARANARLVADRLSDVWDQASVRNDWTAADALTAYRVAEARWQGLNDAVQAVEYALAHAR